MMCEVTFPLLFFSLNNRRALPLLGSTVRRWPCALNVVVNLDCSENESRFDLFFLLAPGKSINTEITAYSLQQIRYNSRDASILCTSLICVFAVDTTNQLWENILFLQRSCKNCYWQHCWRQSMVHCPLRKHHWNTGNRKCILFHSGKRSEKKQNKVNTRINQYTVQL